MLSMDCFRVWPFSLFCALAELLGTVVLSVLLFGPCALMVMTFSTFGIVVMICKVSLV